MNPPRFEEAIRAAARELAAVPGVRSAVLFGSAARGSATEESDIDIFIECNPDAEDPAWKVLLALDCQFGVEFSVIYYRPEDRDAFDKQFLESIVRQGRVLFGGLPRVTPVELVPEGSRRDDVLDPELGHGDASEPGSGIPASLEATARNRSLIYFRPPE